ncbi:unnamed protein product [Meganyctiphanes norvegica]|uniref:Aldehyde dehydrogenase domain-containing protein n=1 Tax=Meganyctiphanes norvegica TaxID=48144 RepID=A0AAV2R0X3_MEGNR
MSLLNSGWRTLSYHQKRLVRDLLKYQGVRNMSKMREEAYIDGQWVSAKSGKTFPVLNPANGKVIANVPDMNETDAELAVDAAHKAFQTWRNTTAKERSVLLRKWFNLMEENQESLSRLLTAEAGKPLAESRGELMYGSSFLEWFAEEAKRINGEVVCSPARSREMIFIRQPAGVASLITPWNFPNAMITRKAGAALAAGCTCIIKPAEDTPLSAIAMVDLAEQAGIPPGVVNVVTSSRGNTPAIGRVLSTHNKISVLSFTGSTPVGRLLYENCARGIKRVGLELGGNAPFIVFNAADLKTTLEAFMVAKFRNAGQTCISGSRFLIQSGVYDEFVGMIKDAMETRLVVGDGMDNGVNFGPLINQSQLNKVDGLVKASIAAGAECLLGGKPHELGGLFYEPTILTNCAETTPCFEEEIFGPVVGIRKFETEEEALQIANSCDVGLAGYIFTQDVSQAWRVARQLETGMIGINEGLISAAEAAFGGVKQSGIGREGSRHGIEEYSEIKYLCFGGIN